MSDHSGSTASADAEKASIAPLDVEEGKQENAPSGVSNPGYIVGWRLHMITVGICMALFISLMESSITSTSILAITNDLSGFEKSSWVFTAYLLSYSGLLIVWAKMSDIFGRKPLLIAATALFTTFSGACGASQTLVQLIMFRWVQGVGGCGIYSIGTLMFFELVPPHKWPNYTAITTFVFAIALATGPLVGGAIVEDTTWRWVFLINCPAGAISIVLLILCLPRKLFNEPSAKSDSAQPAGTTLKSLRRVDIVGALLLLGASLLLSTALQLAAEGGDFGGAPILPLLIIAPIMWIGFVTWSWYITTRRTQPEPVFPWRFFQSRQMLAITANTFLTGTLFTVFVVQIPQRVIAVNGLSPLAAGIRLLPFSILVPGTSVIVSILLKKGVRPFYIQVAGAILQLTGTALFAFLVPDSFEISASQYGFQILAAAGIGCSNIALLIIVPYVCERRDLAVGTATVGQFRLLGGLTGLAIVNSVFVRWIRSPLLDVLSPSQTEALLQRTEILATLPEPVQSTVRVIFAQGYDLQVKILIGFAVAQVLVTAMMWTRNTIQVAHKK